MGEPCKHGWVDCGAPGDLCDSCVYEEGYVAGIEAAAKLVSEFRFFSGSGADMAESIRTRLLQKTFVYSTYLGGEKKAEQQ